MSSDVPRMIDDRLARRPGGSRRGSLPERESGPRLAAWLESGDIVPMEVRRKDDREVRVESPWDLIEWRVPA